MSRSSEAPLRRLWPLVALWSCVYISRALVFMPCHPWEHLWWFLSVFCFSCWAEVWGCNIVCASKAGGQGRLLMNNGCKNNRNKNRAGFKVLSGLWCVCFIPRWSLCKFRLKRKKMHGILLLLLLSNIGFRWLSVSILRIAFCIVNQNPILVKAAQEGCFSLIKLTAPPYYLLCSSPAPCLPCSAPWSGVRGCH